MRKFALAAGHRFQLRGFEHLPEARQVSSDEIWKAYLRSDICIRPTSDLFLYLASPSHVATWVNGGEVPLGSARQYLASENRGVLTVDELNQTVYKDDNAKIVDGTLFDRAIKPPTHFGGMFISVVGSVYNGVAIPNAHMEKRINDALILCLSAKRSREIARRLNDKSHCVRILDFDALLQAINSATSAECKFGPVRYRSDKNRSHFVKGIDNAYMEEFRFVVPDRAEESFWITIPKGVAEDVGLPDC